MGAVSQFGIVSMEHILPKGEHEAELQTYYARAKETVAIYNEIHALKKKHNFAEIATPIVNGLYHKMDTHNLKKLFMLAADFHFVNG